MNRQTLFIVGVVILAVGALSMLTDQPLLVRLAFGIPCAILGGWAFFAAWFNLGKAR